MSGVRPSGRAAHELRPVRIQRGFTRHAEGSVLVEFGDTRVLCTASVEERVPPFLKDSGRGWVTAEYGMLPRATNTRSEREAARGKQSGRTQEIQRLIGRALRAVTDLAALGPRTIQIDCDVLQADGGTRTAAITGGFVALHDALTWLASKGAYSSIPVADFVAAVSVGVYQGTPILDLDYAEDSACGCDMNVVMTGDGRLRRDPGHRGGRDVLSSRIGRAPGSGRARYNAARARAEKGAWPRLSWSTTTGGAPPSTKRSTSSRNARPTSRFSGKPSRESCAMCACWRSPAARAIGRSSSRRSPSEVVATDLAEEPMRIAQSKSYKKPAHIFVCGRLRASGFPRPLRWGARCVLVVSHPSAAHRRIPRLAARPPRAGSARGPDGQSLRRGLEHGDLGNRRPGQHLPGPAPRRR